MAFNLSMPTGSSDSETPNSDLFDSRSVEISGVLGHTDLGGV